ncbi:ferredoxin [Nocardia blacklockiae]|uniref:ferredoxin n=1 Tax=Nocardia blacklockiae TaxID=480036 RepID=UPI0018935701|nr:ferredoxin [Nocardia blacklockiae]MBF6170186.1 ferredoxin [Nocardia blacklockiae]
MTRIEVDLDLCQGHAVCQAEAPEIFTVPKHGKAQLRHPPTDRDRAEVENAVRYCPTQALSVVEDDRTPEDEG